jgi:hypothetical protein
MSSSSALTLAELRDGPMYRFADWPNPEVPNGRIGVYTVRGGDELIYVGMGGRAVGPSADTNGPASAKLTGLRSRLASHASGRRGEVRERGGSGRRRPAQVSLLGFHHLTERSAGPVCF